MVAAGGVGPMAGAGAGGGGRHWPGAATNMAAGEEIARAVRGFGVSDTSNPASKKFFDFALEEICNSKQTLFAALAAAVVGESAAPAAPRRPPAFEEVLFSDDLEFEATFRITRKTVRVILKDLRTEGCSASLEKDLLLMLYCLGQPGERLNWQEVAGVFETTPDRARALLVSTSSMVLERLKDKYVTWPSDESRKQIIQMSLMRKFKFPKLNGVLGCILLQDKRLALEVVVDHDNMFRWVFSKSGVSNPVAMLAHSGLGHRVFKCDGRKEGYILAGPLYPAMGQLLPPYNHPKSEDEKTFNRMHSKAVGILADSVQFLTARFPLLGRLDFDDVEHSRLVVEAACVLHNICLASHDLASCSSYPLDDYAASSPAYC